MGRPLIKRNLNGQKFGRWTAASFAGIKNKRKIWACVCECGTERIVREDALIRGKSLGCGCHSVQYMNMKNPPHGMTNTPEYKAWRAMLTRCYSKSSGNYSVYGGRGISVCDKWAGSFLAFLEDMGPKPSPNHSVDRIDCTGNYSPENCRWATQHEQANNKSNNRVLEYNGMRMTVAQWTRETGLTSRMIHHRIGLGWSDEAVLSTPRLRSRKVAS